MSDQSTSWCVLIPCFNEEKAIGEVVSSAMKLGRPVIVVDDGSEDRTAEIASEFPVELLRHPHQRGNGRRIGSHVVHNPSLTYPIRALPHSFLKTPGRQDATGPTHGNRQNLRASKKPPRGAVASNHSSGLLAEVHRRRLAVRWIALEVLLLHRELRSCPQAVGKLLHKGVVCL